MPEQKLMQESEMGWRLDNTYLKLPALFYRNVAPVPVGAPRLVLLNKPLTQTLGLDFEDCDEGQLAGIFAGNILPQGSQPVAQAYAGHQYGNFTMLGDGRAILLGEQVTPQNERVDIQLKGSGETPYSRNGDGRAALGPMLREYIISEAMHGLGIPTTRSLAVVLTGEAVMRETVLSGAVLTRVAASHIRVGTFEYAAARMGETGVRALADYTIARHYPQVASTDNPYLSLLRAVIERQASLVAKWLLVGFVHGVMNTDNMAVSGETIDYGPCAFIDAYDPDKAFSSIDRYGRYAFMRQPDIAQWNLARFAEALLPLLDKDLEKAIALAEAEISAFAGIFRRCWISGMSAKLGLLTEEADDASLIDALLAWMEKSHADFTNTFRGLALDALPASLSQDEAFMQWHSRWRARLALQPGSADTWRRLMNANNPEVIPRNHHVEKALSAANAGDFKPLHLLLKALQDPYAARKDRNEYLTPAAAMDCAYRTYCGT